MKFSAVSLYLAIGLASTTAASAAAATPRTLQILDRTIVSCSLEAPCDECQGDCDTDEDCEGDLICQQRGAAISETEAVVPGCDGVSYSRTDFCVVADAATDDTDATTAPTDMASTGMDDAEGFEDGMAAEIAGLWVGEEKYKDGEIVYNYCSRALFQPSEYGNYLTWHGYYLGFENETCADIGVNPMTGGVDNPTYFTDSYDPEESYVLRLDKKVCLLESDCTYDVTTSDSFADYELMESSCGAHLKRDLMSEYYSCELYQVNQIKNKGDGTEELVVILTYSHFTGGYNNFSCSDKPTYDMDEFLSDPIAEGTARFVLQSGYDTNTNSTFMDWECLV